MTDGEHDRLARELLDDMTIQFQTFRFGVATAVVLMGAVVAWVSSPLGGERGVFQPVLFLLPAAILLPSSLTILNRARTRNRKAAFVIAVIDAQRLQEEGKMKSSASELECGPVPWETALHLAFRRGRPHWSSFHKASMAVFTTMEAACGYMVWVAGWSNLSGPRADKIHFLILAVSGTLLLLAGWWFRLRAFCSLRKEHSIQGFVAAWLRSAYDRNDRQTWPRYLREFVEEYERNA